MNSASEEAEGDQLSEESWNKVEEDDYVVEELNEEDSSAFASHVGGIDPDATDATDETAFPARVMATEHDESEGGTEESKEEAIASNEALDVVDANVSTDDIEPTPVMSPAEILRANSIRSPDTMVSPTSQLFPALNLVLPPHMGADAESSDPLGTSRNSSALDMASPTANFAHVIRERTRQRRLKDDAAVASLRVQVTRLEAALAAATKRRVESIKALQTHATTAVSQLETRLSAQVTADITRVNDRLNGLEQRMAALESRWNEEVCGLQQDVSQSSQQLHSQLQTLQHTVTQERVQATTRHDRLMQQIQAVSASYDERWQQERQDRMASVLSLQETMDAVHSERELSVATIEGQLQEELRALQAAVTLEQHERRAHDDDIVQSLNRYTRYIQESLAAATGVTFQGSGGSVDYDTLTLR